jgi:hypothetical protein
MTSKQIRQRWPVLEVLNRRFFIPGEAVDSEKITSKKHFTKYCTYSYHLGNHQVVIQKEIQKGISQSVV